MSGARIANPAEALAFYVGARLIAGDSIAEIVVKLDAQLADIRREYAIQSTSVLTSPVYSMTKAVADNLRARC